MPISHRAAAVQAALEQALDSPVHLQLLDGRAHIRAVAPGPRDVPAWQAVMPILRSADRWGSTDTGEGPQIWAEVNEG